MNELHPPCKHTHITRIHTSSLPASDSTESICAILLENRVQTRHFAMSSKAVGKCSDFIKDIFYFAVIATFKVGQLRGPSNPE